MKRTVFLAFVCAAWGGMLFAQPPPGARSESQLEAYSEYYRDSADNEAALFSGKVQQPVARRTESLYLRQRGVVVRDAWGNAAYPEPVLPLESYSEGTLLYDGILYKGVQLRLDLHRDELVVLAPSRINGIILESERVGYADLRGYRNIHIRPGNPKYNLPGGYYQILYSGGIEVLKKETFQYHTSENAFVNRVVRYYIEKEGVYHRVDARKGPVLRLLKEHRVELKRFIRQAGIVFRNDPEKAVETVAAEYDALHRRK